MEHRQLRLAVLRVLGAPDRADCADPDAEIVARVEGLVRERPQLLEDRARLEREAREANEALLSTIGERDRAFDAMGQALARVALLEAAAGSALDGGADLLDRVRLAVDPDEEEDLRTAEDVVDAVRRCHAEREGFGRRAPRELWRLRDGIHDTLAITEPVEALTDEERLARIDGVNVAYAAALGVVARLRQTIARAADALAQECEA